MITIYSKADCPRCEEAKAAIERLGYEYTVIDLEKVMSGEIVDTAVIVQLAMQNMAAPVVIDQRGKAIDLDDLEKMKTTCRVCGWPLGSEGHRIYCEELSFEADYRRQREKQLAEEIEEERRAQRGEG